MKKLPNFPSVVKKKINFNWSCFTPADLLWTAPELLRQEYVRPTSGSQKREFYRKLVNLQKCDVYSFAIILQEFHTRKGPYSNNSNLDTKGKASGNIHVAIPEVSELYVLYHDLINSIVLLEYGM